VIPGSVLNWQAVAEKYAAIYSILNPEEILSIIWTESTGNAKGENPGDPSWGLMGVTTLIARSYGGFTSGDDSWKTDGDKNVRAGAGFLAYLKDRYSAKYPNWVEIYNVGETKFLRGIGNPDYSRRFFSQLNALTTQQAG